MLFSVFLYTKFRTKGSRTIVFTIDLAVSTTGYVIDKIFMFDKHISGEYLFRDTITISAKQSETSWNINFNFMSDGWGDKITTKIMQDEDGFYIPLESQKGFKGRLRLIAEAWN